jgi:SAM-dependent methyltransferase
MDCEISEPGCLSFRCNVCGELGAAKVTELDREKPSCANCGSTVRCRAIVHLLSVELFGLSLALPDFPVKPEISGLGMSDWDGYAVPLAKKFSFVNTYFHQEPKLDITTPDLALEGKYDFVISTEVFEHIPPPVTKAFENTRKLLKPDGVLIFTVPYWTQEQTIEHFPDLYDYEIKESDGHPILRNTTKDGIVQTFDKLIFHGGPGATLEMRLFSEASLLENFKQAGFHNVKVYQDPHFEYGIYWPHNWSLPIAARIS